MPVLALVGAAAAYFGAGALVTAIGVTGITATVVGVVAGAVIGAAVGAIGAAITGGDIGKGALWGAVGGAVAGGVAGYAAGAAGTGSSHASVAAELRAGSGGIGANPSPVAAGGAGGAGGSGAGSGGLLGNNNYALGQAISTGGDMVSGWAQGEAGVDATAAAKDSQQDLFAQRMKEIDANHKNSLDQIRAKSSDNLALSNQNNAANMEQLNTRIGADKDTVDATLAEQEARRNSLNESIRGTDANLFNLPTFDFNPGQDNKVAFNSGFDEAVQSRSLTPEQQAELARQQATA